jgi:hypothetical protein
MSDHPERYILPAKIGPRAKGDFRTIPISMKLLRVLATLAVVALSVWAGVTFKNAWVSVALAGYFAAAALFVKLRAIRRRKRFVADFGGSLDAVRANLDLVHLRAVRDQEGEASALREVFRQVPGLNVAPAMVIVRTL